MATTTSNKVSKKVLPAALVKAVKDHSFEHGQKTGWRLVVVHDDAHAETAYNTRWDGGTRNQYTTWYFENDSLKTADVAECDKFSVGYSLAWVVLSVFCGKPCNPVVYVRSADLAKFFGCEVPAPFDTMPAEVQADYLDEQAEHQSPKAAQAFRVTAEKCRILSGAKSVA